MKRIVTIGTILALALISSIAFSAYHHAGEMDSGNFLEVCPDKAGTKLDHCALCHTGGEYEKNGRMVSIGSCQWCHHSYGYDGSGNITDTLNAYGKDYFVNGRDADAVRAIESLDSDGDGFTNKAEIDAVRFPGNADDDPSKKTAPFKIYTRSELEALSPHTQFMLMNTTKSGDFYAEYTGVPMEDLLKDAGILDSATGITVYAPDGWSQYHPMTYDENPEMYQVSGVYPSAVYHHDPQAESWCDYSAPSCAGRNHDDPIQVSGGLKMILAYKRDGANLEAGVLNQENKLDILPGISRNPQPEGGRCAESGEQTRWRGTVSGCRASENRVSPGSVKPGRRSGCEMALSGGLGSQCRRMYPFSDNYPGGAAARGNH